MRIVYEAHLKTRTFNQGVRDVERGAQRVITAMGRAQLAFRHFERGNIARGFTHLGGAAAGAARSMAHLGAAGWGAAKRIGDGFQSVFSLMGRITRRVGVLAAAMGAFGGVAVAKSAEFESEISRVAILSGAKGGERGDLRKKAVDVGIETPFSLMDIAQSQKQFAQIGFKPSEIQELVDATKLLAVLGDTDMATAGEALAQVMQQFSIPTEKATDTALKLGGALIATALNGDELFDAMKQAGSAAGVFKADLTEVLAVVGHLRSSLDVNQASTAVRNLFLITSALSAKNDKQLTALGFSREEAQGLSFMRGGNKSLVDTIQGLGQHFEQNPEMAMKAGFEQRTILAFKRIGETGREVFEEIKRGINDTATTQGQYAQIIELLDNKLTRVKSSAEAVLVALGTKITSAFGVENAIDLINEKLGEVFTTLEGMTDAEFRGLAETLPQSLIEAFAAGITFFVNAFLAAMPIISAAMLDVMRSVWEQSMPEFAGGITAADADQRRAMAMHTPSGLRRIISDVEGKGGVGSPFVPESERRGAMAAQHELDRRGRYGPLTQDFLGNLGAIAGNAMDSVKGTPFVRGVEAVSEAVAGRAAVGKNAAAVGAAMSPAIGQVNNGLQFFFGGASPSARAKPLRKAGTSSQEAAGR